MATWDSGLCVGANGVYTWGKVCSSETRPATSRRAHTVAFVVGTRRARDYQIGLPVVFETIGFAPLSIGAPRMKIGPPFRPSSGGSVIRDRTRSAKGGRTPTWLRDVKLIAKVNAAQPA